MRTTLNIPEPLLDEACRLLKVDSKTEAVILSLKELVRRQRIAELKDLFGKINLDIDLSKSRRRGKSRG